MNVLVVDDHEENRYLLESLFKGRGQHVLTAANGAEAMGVLETGRIDLIISDILMPVMDGFQLCRKVKSDRHLMAIPFIVYTATYTGPQDERFAMKIGADRFVIKPCEPDVFMTVVDEVMDAARRRGDTQPPQAREEEVLKLYSERLVRKLEHKMLQAESEIAARREVEQALRESEQRLIAAQRIAKMGDFTWDLETGAITWSQPLSDLLGYDRSENFDQTRIHAQIFHMEDRERIDRWLDDGIASGREDLAPIEYRVLRKDGRILNVRTAGVIQNRPGKKPRIFATVQDVTERKKAEEERAKLQAQLLQAKKMESVGRMAGGVAHDYNNLLAVISGYAELGLGKTRPGDPLHEYLTEIHKAARRSSGITQQLLAFARKQSSSPVVLDLNKTIAGMLNMLRRLIGNEIELELRPAAGLWPIKMDPSQADQVLTNLCVNARDAVAGAGRIIIETRNAGLDDGYCVLHAGVTPGDYVELSVRDNGCGMNPQTMESMFEPFFTTKKLGKGTGLGLSTVYGIIKQNDGFIDVESEPDKGAIFRIYLPRRTGEV